MNTRRKFLTAFLATALIFTSVPFAVAAKNSKNPGLGGTTGWKAGSVFPLRAGVVDQITSWMLVQNIGPADAEVDLSVNAPPGITVQSGYKLPYTIKPKESVKFPLTISNSKGTGVGTYDVIISMKQINVPHSKAGTVMAPAINGIFKVAVMGESSTVRIDAVSKQDHTPAIGDISIFYLSQNTQPLLLETIHGSSLTRKVVPGKYRALFEIPGLISKGANFTVRRRETKHIVLEVPGIQFAIVVAKPVYDSNGDLSQAKLVADLRNQLAPIEEPMKLMVRVTHDGEKVEDFKMAEITSLPLGLSEYTSSYRPVDGFSRGEWRFEFELAAKFWKVTSDDKPVIYVGGPLFIWWFLGLALLIVLLVTACRTGLLPFNLCRFFLFGKRREEDEEETTELSQLPDVEPAARKLTPSRWAKAEKPAKQLRQPKPEATDQQLSPELQEWLNMPIEDLLNKLEDEDDGKPKD